MQYYTIEPKDFFETQRKDLCGNFKDNIQAYASCIVSVSDFSHNLMKAGGLFGDLKRGVEIRTGILPLKIKKESFNDILSRARGNCQAWGIPPTAPEKEKEKSELMIRSCLAGISNFQKELFGEKEKQKKLY